MRHAPAAADQITVIQSMAEDGKNESARQISSLPRAIRRSAQQSEDRLWPEAEDQRGDGEHHEFADEAGGEMMAEDDPLRRRHEVLAIAAGDGGRGRWSSIVSTFATSHAE